jgi:hypothetical protein
MREIGGDALLYCNPYKPQDIYEMMARMAGDSKTREEYGTKANERAGMIDLDQSLQFLTRMLDAGAVDDVAPTGSRPPTAKWKHIEGIYPDNWLAPEATICFSEHNRFRKIVFTFEAHAVADLFPLKLTFSLNKGSLGTYRVLSPGTHVVEFSLEDEAAYGTGSSSQTLISSNKSFVPKRLGWSDDARELSIQVKSILAVGPDSNVIEFYP